MFHGPLPAGPKGQFGMHSFTSHVMPTYSKNQKAAKDLLRYFHKKENYDQWFSTAAGLLHTGNDGLGKPPGLDQGPDHGAVRGCR